MLTHSTDGDAEAQEHTQHAQGHTANSLASKQVLSAEPSCQSTLHGGRIRDGTLGFLGLERGVVPWASFHSQSPQLEVEGTDFVRREHRSMGVTPTSPAACPWPLLSPA